MSNKAASKPAKQAKTGASPRGAHGHFLSGPLNPKNLKPSESGIQKGTKHTSTMLREAVLNVFFNRVGGEDYLAGLARSKKYKGHFVQLLTKVLPQATELSGAGGGPIDVQLLALAQIGIAKMTDEQLEQFRGLLKVMGAGDVFDMEVPAANDVRPEEARGTA